MLRRQPHQSPLCIQLEPRVAFSSWPVLHRASSPWSQAMNRCLDTRRAAVPSLSRRIDVVVELWSEGVDGKPAALATVIRVSLQACPFARVHLKHIFLVRIGIKALV